MATAQLGAVVRHIREMVDAGKVREQTDVALLRAFLSRNDQSAFEALVRRHGPMVLRVCRRTLGDAHDAEDALQATFLLLAQKAASIRRRESLASWLHGVAYRMATHAKRAAARRHTHEADARPAQPRDPAVLAAWQEVQVFLDDEIQRLPEGLRDAFVHCCLEHKSSAEAAQQLGVEETTVRKRLSRARKLLQERLARRGVSLTAVLAAAALGANGALAAVPRSLVASTAKAATLIAAGKAATVGLVPTKVAALIEGVHKAMLFTTLKTTAVVLISVALAGTGAGLVTYRALAGQPGGPPANVADKGLKADDAARIAKLVEQLGSDNFANREAAEKELDRIGAPALDALRKAARGDDPERGRRAAELAKKIEGRERQAALLAPKRVHLIYKDTPLAEAVADFRKQSGYELAVSDPEGKLKDRKVTLDTGYVTFWQALDLFCQKTHVVAAGPSSVDGGTRPFTRPTMVAAPPATGEATGGKPGPGAFVLTDGETRALPTDGRSSVRVRAVPRAGRGGPQAEGASLLTLEVTPEPRLRLLEIFAVHIRKATDEKGQNRDQVIALGGPTLPAGPRAMSRDPLPDIDVRLTQVCFQKGAAGAASLSEITGTISIRVRVEGDPPDKRSTLAVPFTLKKVPLE